jgi:cytochrome c553
MVPVPTRAEQASGQVEKGRLLAERMCAICHLNPDQGEKAGPGTVPGFVAVAKRPGQSIDRLIAWLRSVPAMMPNHHLSQDEMEALAFFILSLADGAPTSGVR